jgi:adenylate kinase family enzyme
MRCNDFDAVAAHEIEDRFQPNLLDIEKAANISGILSARRILLLGSSGAGKTHLSERLSDILGIPAIHLDAHFWQPGHVPRGEREWRGIVSTLVQRESWIMDGTYERSLDLRIPHADAIIVLDGPGNRCLDRVLRRQRETEGKQRRDRAEGCAERVDLNHVRYVMQYEEVTRPQIVASIERYGRGKPVAEIRGPEHVDPFVSTLKSAVAA